jgi:hypothetical protein
MEGLTALSRDPGREVFGVSFVGPFMGRKTVNFHALDMQSLSPPLGGLRLRHPFAFGFGWQATLRRPKTKGDLRKPMRRRGRWDAPSALTIA